MNDSTTTSIAGAPVAGAPGPTEQGFFSVLTESGLIAFGGVDAAKFLHNQLTNDVLHLASHDARLAGYCSPKGRLLATMLVWRTDETVFVQLARDLQAATQKRLQMFVMRDKVTVQDATDAHVVIGLGGATATELLTHWFPTLPAAPYSKCDSPAGSLVRVADAFAQPRYQWVMPLAIAPQIQTELAAALPQVDSAYWRLAEIAAAVPHITLATQEKFVPQMVNLEAVGGVSFKKGCYPGQEIVARSQYLGKLKRRMLPASVTAAQVTAGMEVFSADDTEQPCGMVVNAARDPQDTSDRFNCLVEVKTAIAETRSVHLGPNGPLLHFSALPYALPDSV